MWSTVSQMTAHQRPFCEKGWAVWLGGAGVRLHAPLGPRSLTTSHLPSLVLVGRSSSLCLVSCFFLRPSLEPILRNLSPFPPLHFHPGENVAVSSAKLLLNQRSGRGLTWKSQRKIWIAAAHAISLVFFSSVAIIWFSLSNWQQVHFETLIDMVATMTPSFLNWGGDEVPPRSQILLFQAGAPQLCSLCNWDEKWGWTDRRWVNGWSI